MKTLAVILALSCLGQGAGALAGDCAEFRCRYGDVPGPPEPLITEPFHVFYGQPTTRPMVPYQRLDAGRAQADVAIRQDSEAESMASPRHKEAQSAVRSAP
ncbi:hypothetical protein EVC62_04140 [Salinicola endophyticus]|uniref:Uncharacterized protein n=1 Tax=Salinicola endophyticus TaxID=1949083 RepID=A0ABY8FJJ4_9GAMM|nr:hypothetical protein [Salinicola endophyticus]WFF40751.1 hypothetical protein EVC62_04140 [Salinicola endophyticus]